MHRDSWELTTGEDSILENLEIGQKLRGFVTEVVNSLF